MRLGGGAVSAMTSLSRHQSVRNLQNGLSCCTYYGGRALGVGYPLKTIMERGALIEKKQNSQRRCSMRDLLVPASDANRGRTAGFSLQLVGNPHWPNHPAWWKNHFLLKRGNCVSIWKMLLQIVTSSYVRDCPQSRIFGPLAAILHLD